MSKGKRASPSVLQGGTSSARIPGAVCSAVTLPLPQAGLPSPGEKSDPRQSPEEAEPREDFTMTQPGWDQPHHRAEPTASLTHLPLRLLVLGFAR